MKKVLTGFVFTLLAFVSSAQYKSSLAANEWVDSVFRSLTKEQKIAQLMIIRAHSNLGPKHIAEVTDLINKYNIGGLCFFQGGPIRQANLTNFYQSIAKTPLMITIDGEWGVGMRLDSVINLPRQLMLGAVNDPQLVYQYGRVVGEQCKRLGIHVNFAPVVDVNNNPKNPVINDRSFGEDKYKVANYGIQYMKGMQDVGVMACAKHFPGHGDVEVDSHYDLPVINKTREQLDSLELYPFRQILNAGVGSVMVAHLYIPSIDKTANQATSLSYKNITGILRNELGYKGIVFTDALDMKGITKFFPEGEASVRSLLAGNDMLCLPGDVPGSIEKTLKAIKKGKLTWTDLDARVKKVLLAKYNLGLNQHKHVDTTNIVADLNKGTLALNRKIASAAITSLKQDSTNSLFPLKNKKVAYLAVGVDQTNHLGRQLKAELKADVFNFTYKRDAGSINMLTTLLKEKYDVVIIGMHNYSRRPANNYGLSAPCVNLVKTVQAQMPTVTLVFGNPYAMKEIAPGADNLLACYEDDEITQQAAFDVLTGKVIPKGTLPVTVSDQLQYGTGMTSHFFFPVTAPEAVGLQSASLSYIDSIANDAIVKKATPGCVVLVAKNGSVAFQKAYGYTTYDSTRPVTVNMVYDLASITKTAATTLAVMKLYEQGLLQLHETVGEHLTWMAGSGKEGISLRNMLLHQGGLASWIPFFRETLDASGTPLPTIYQPDPIEGYTVKVADNLYMRSDWVDTIYQRIITSRGGRENNYVYSDLDFILLGKIVEAVAGVPLDQYVTDMFYRPLGLSTLTFNPLDKIDTTQIAPTENEPHFRKQLVHGYVHDPGAAMLGGVAGHAGLFGNAYELAVLYQMLLNGGEINGIRFFEPETVELFTSYNSDISRRGLGFDKPEKNNASRSKPYPTASASHATFGHTGFTGTSVWADPIENLVYVFLSNRVMPNSEPNKLQQMDVRGKIHEVIYRAIVPMMVQVARE
ncbi:glycoside hydrolase family 3 N-terminal domain-containing protein [Aridibaculum aurantiacum]|uniref:glycoside hydrolase family 3 N-terminal domain-containing protein n=1 Tax=Aridibaculum aurantiacum TaxID=2810307 RepID=UPI001F620057|nr:glycoside hydrolase family 3 N-terminal domain-containing protein [Aridibaculum aurantiacum]